MRPKVTNPSILRALEESQPYCGPNGEIIDPRRSPLWQLHRLDIIDKHRLLLVVRFALRIPGMYWGVTEGLEPPRLLRLNTAPLEEGDPVAWFDFHGREPPGDFDPHLGIEISLRERELAQLAFTPLIGFLEGLVWWIEWPILNYRFRPLFPA